MLKKYAKQPINLDCKKKILRQNAYKISKITNF